MFDILVYMIKCSNRQLQYVLIGIFIFSGAALLPYKKEVMYKKWVTKTKNYYKIRNKKQYVNDRNEFRRISE